MRLLPLLLSSLILGIAGCASSGVAINHNVTDALTNPASSDADHERDCRDKPHELLSLAARHARVKVKPIHKLSTALKKSLP